MHCRQKSRLKSMKENIAKPEKFFCSIMCKKHIILKRDITIGGKPKHNNNYSHLHTQGNEKTRIRRRQIASMRLVFSRVF